MTYKRITAHRALTMLRELERIRQFTTDAPHVRCAVDNVINALDAHVRREFRKVRR